MIATMPTRPTRPEVCVYIATSLDGYIARPDGAIDWLLQAQATAPAGEDFGYAAFMAGVDALVMGRRTFDTVRGFDPWPYAGKPVHVMTRQRGLALPPTLQAQVRLRHEAPAALLAVLAAEGVRRVYLDGGELIQAFLREGLVDRLTVTTVPVLIGQGRPLWGALAADQHWALASDQHRAQASDQRMALGAVRHWDCGFVQTTHVRRRETGGDAPGSAAVTPG
jgi:dihydrofolate reductase